MAAASPPTPSPFDALIAACAIQVGNEHDAAILRATEIWLETAVIGLGLCPFAKAVHRKKQIRYVVSNATDRETLECVLTAELQLLHTADAQKIDTTLLIHPYVLQDFFDYNGFLQVANRIIKRQGLRGAIQLASFHPDYAFAHCASDALENCTNRSPYPMLHLLREASIEKALATTPDAEDIYLRNIATLQALGIEGWNHLWREAAGNTR